MLSIDSRIIRRTHFFQNLKFVIINFNVKLAKVVKLTGQTEPIFVADRMTQFCGTYDMIPVLHLVHVYLHVTII